MSDNNQDKNHGALIMFEFIKYFGFWKWYLLSIIFFGCSTFFYLRYTQDVFLSTAKIKILEKDAGSLQLPTAENFFSKSQINLENEIEVIRSFPILEEVVRELNLTSNFYSSGDIMSSRLLEFPFDFVQKISFDKINERQEYNIVFNLDNIIVSFNDETFIFKENSTLNQKHNLPFDCAWNRNSIKNNSYSSFTLVMRPLKNVINELKKKISLSVVGNKSEIIAVNYQSENTQISENIINSLINNFNEDGVKDRQLVFQRTINFVNDRFIDLSAQLDSIETEKKEYKLKNKFIDIKSNASLSLQQSSNFNEKLFFNENQMLICKMLFDTYSDSGYNLLPINLFLENNPINNLTMEYNNLVLKRRDLSYSLGINNSALKTIDKKLRQIKENIISSVNSHLIQLQQTKNQLLQQNSTFDEDLNNLPQKEKILRSIERNQMIKEKLFLYLLQKREEAEVSYAITEPTVKVVEYAVSEEKSNFPNRKIIYFLSFVLAFLFPSLGVYLIFLFDNKVYTKEGLESANLVTLGEIPFFKLEEKTKLFSDPNSRDIISESFRMLMSNVKYLFKSQKECNVMIVSSSIKGEGKTLTAMNLSLAFASLNKKVLLIGCDLRNPQIHKNIDEDKNTKGLINFLVDPSINWRESILKKFDNHPTHDILLSGSLPPNPLNLINNGNFDILIEQAKKEYDYIIIDSAPTLLVADTKSIYHLADTLVYLVRCGVTDKDIIKHIQSISKENAINLGVVLNGVGEKNAYGYSYGYQYGYGYNYKYSYNYGYGYGYEEDKS